MKYLTTICAVALLWTTGASAQGFAYPAQGQSPQQQQQDEGECYNWAKGQTGFDPANPPQVSAAPPADTGPQGDVVRGAARGALLGEVIDDDAGKGAAAGALLGGFKRRNRMREQKAQANQYEQQQAAQIQQMSDAYNRAYGTCLAGRGYTVG